MDKTTASIIGAIKKEQQALLESMVDFPKKDVFDHGVQVGQYQGLARALTLVENVLDDQLNEEARL